MARSAVLHSCSILLSSLAPLSTPQLLSVLLVPILPGVLAPMLPGVLAGEKGFSPIRPLLVGRPFSLERR